MISSKFQDKFWRTSQIWYKKGKSNECEIFQIKAVEDIIGKKCTKTSFRINSETLEFKEKTQPMNFEDGFDWTEDFDGYFENKEVNYYVNMKFVCDQGGSQTRTLREVYNFIKTQIKFIKDKDDLFFVNILDGDFAFKNRSKYKYLLDKHKPKNIFVGDSLEFRNFWNNKKNFGQYYTTNFEYILSGMKVPENSKDTILIEPMAGNGDLLNWCSEKFKNIECYDIDPKKNFIIQRDTLRNPPDYTGKFLITNPPYLARNKSLDKTLFDKYKVNDLYKCLIKNLLTNKPISGILIIPLNFFSSIRTADSDLRRNFLKFYTITKLNIFTEKVFEDTSYSVCSFSFKLGCSNLETDIVFFPQNIKLKFHFTSKNNFIGEELYNLPQNSNIKISRATSKNLENITDILVKCIDDETKINMSINPEHYIDSTPRLSSRSYATLTIFPAISKARQELLVKQFNNFLDEKRKKYNSLFLTNYREGERKRISFELVYNITNYLLNYTTF